MARKKLQAKQRKVFGRRVKHIRHQDKVPGNVFGPNTKSKALTIEKKELLSVFKEAGETNLIDLVVEGEKNPRPVLITDIQTHPATNEALHVDLHQVDLTEKTTADIPVETVGEAPAVEKGGILVPFLNEIEVEALPEDLPEKFEVDISSLEEIGDTILVKDLDIDREKIKLLVEEKEPVVSIQEPEPEEEPEPTPEEEAEEGEPEGEEAPEEGEEEGKKKVKKNLKKAKKNKKKNPKN